MVWIIEFHPDVEKDLKKLSRPVQKQVIEYLSERIAGTPDPTVFGKPLSQNLAGYWRFRVNDYRIICRIDGKTVTILVILVAHRKDVYQKADNRLL